MSNQSNYRFAFGPWNIHEGADPFGPTVRPTVAFAKKLSVYRELGFEGIEFHDDDAVPDVDKKSAQQRNLFVALFICPQPCIKLCVFSIPLLLHHER